MYSANILEDIKDRLALSEVISRFVPLKKRGHEYMGRCPFHEERTPSFTVNNQKAFYHCFGCGAHGNIFDFLKHHYNLNFMEAVQQAAELAGVTLPKFEPHRIDTSEENLKKDLLKILEETCQFFEKHLHTSLGTEARDYLQAQRHLTPQTLKSFRIGFAPEGRALLKDFLQEKGFSIDLISKAGLLSSSEDGRESYDKFRKRIIFPILNRQGKVIGFGGRILGSGEPKYLNSPETLVFNKGTILYNLTKAASSSQRQDPLLVVEGYMDVISLFQQGYERVVAPMGTALTEGQMEEAWRLTPEPSVCFDGDTAGQRAALRSAERALPLLTPGKSLSFLTLPSSEDPDSLIQKIGLQKFKEFLKDSRPLIDILWEREVQKYPRKTPEQKALLERSLETLSTTIQNAAVRHHYSKDFKSRFYLWQRQEYTKKSSLSKESGPINRKSLNVSTVHENILLGTILMHPQLLEEAQEEFATLEFQNPPFQNLQKRILSYYFDHLPLEKEALCSYLIKCGEESELNQVLNLNLKTHAPLLWMNNLEEIGKFWHHICELYYGRSHAKGEITKAKDLLSQELSNKSWERFKHLKNILSLPQIEE